MGSCASVHKGSQESAMKLGLSFESKTNKLVIPASPVKEKSSTGDHSTIKSLSMSNFGSKEETFFESRPWLDSDCEDDFYSVNGEFTPSRGSTPVHHNFMGTPRVNKSSEDKNPDSAVETLPTRKKKKLVELFRESIRENPDVGEQNLTGEQNNANGKVEAKQTIQDVLPKSANGTPYISGANSASSSERTDNGDDTVDKERSFRSVQCCLPNLVSCRSLSERKKRMSPAVTVN